jgi:hypothetical protein
LCIFDTGFENGVSELHAGDSKFDSTVAEFDISDSVDHVEEHHDRVSPVRSSASRRLIAKAGFRPATYVIIKLPRTA